MAQDNSAFPNNKQKALEMLYSQAQDLSGKTPEDIATMYDDAYTRICKKFYDILEERKRERQRSVI